MKSWEELHKDIILLAEKIREFGPDIIVPCMLGGLIPGAIIAKHLGIKDVRPIDIERKGTERILAYDIIGDIDKKRLLIVEDDLPTGKGPQLVKRIFEERGAVVKIAALYVNSMSSSIADFYVEKRGAIPDYPWKRFHSGDRLRNT